MGVAKVNAYKLYTEMYDAEKSRKETGLPPRWSHREFIRELIFDMMTYSPSSTSNKHSLSDIGDDNDSLASSVCSSRHSLSAAACFDDNDNDESKDDFNCASGIESALKKF